MYQYLLHQSNFAVHSGFRQSAAYCVQLVPCFAQAGHIYLPVSNIVTIIRENVESVNTTLIPPVCNINIPVMNVSESLLHKVKMQYLHFNSPVEYFLLSWKIPEVIIIHN